MVAKEDQTADDLKWMDEAVIMAEEALHAKEIPVGCVLVHDGKIVARGRNRTNEGRNATLHAEFDALRHLLPDRSHALTPQLVRPFTPQLPDCEVHEDDDDEPSSATPEPGSSSSVSASPAAPRPKKRKVWQTPLRGVVLYVTVEPCLMCASAMRQVGIETVIYGCANDRFGGCGGVQSIHADERLLYAPPYPAFGGYRREEAIMLLRRFYISENSTAPKPKKKSNRILKTEIKDTFPSRGGSPSVSGSPRPSTPASLVERVATPPTPVLMELGAEA
ncbi:hypothetical protein JCM8547_001635 [Rhodosporidiobolus lusitaniae]